VSVIATHPAVVIISRFPDASESCFSFSRIIFDAVFFRAAEYPWYADYCHGMQVMLPVFDDDFPINYSKMQQVTFMECHVWATGTGDADKRVS
jgi:hypothetical protein